MKQLDSFEINTADYDFGDNTYKQILLNAPVAVTITDHLGNIILINQYFSDITGYTEHELNGKNCSILSYKTTPKSVYENLWATISTGKHWQGQLINKKKNGDLYIAEISISRFQNTNGDTFYYAIHKDITEKIQLQTQQKNQSAMFEAVLNSAPIAIALIDHQENILFKNRLFENLTTDIHQSPVTLLSDYLITNYQYRSIGHFMQNKQRKYKGIHLNGSGSGIDRWFDYALAKIPVTDTAAEAYFHPTDEYYTVIGIIERTKEKQYLEERRINTIKLMANDNKYVHAMQEAMMATLHQLQGPFNMIESAVNILKRRNNACPGLVAMDEAMSNAIYALDEIKQAIPERGDEAFQPVNLNQVVRDATTISTEQLLTASAKLEITLAATLPSIKGKPNRLLLAVKQLLDNAVDAIQSSRSRSRAIQITTTESDDDISLIIDDSGNGVEPGVRLKIFQPFYSTKPRYSSGCRGIGLAIVQQVINEHSATINIDNSARLGGARITLTFPKYSY
ncbi:nitrogen fixation negative regulator NifL [Vibrio sp. HA2012]|uniref:nitrogen fixation negative regulator NifL n=1 Tax=Vibrio sp. HA2012 TaxID=1971595 RepID=UPI000C2C5044|nr:nitrogen fixation negative regulator NifL [Vibrio sp. HA2012]PJC87622.1 nitrogen fixation negative regulator NifL [Vibrio sp. HA2012]